MTPDHGLLDALRIQVSPEAGLFLGSLRDSFGPLLLLYASRAPDDRERLRWMPALRDAPPEGFSLWAYCACGSLLVDDTDRPSLADACLDVELAELGMGGATPHCTSLYLTACLRPLDGADLALRRRLEADLFPLDA